MVSPSLTPVSTRMPGPVGSVQPDDAARRRARSRGPGPRRSAAPRWRARTRPAVGPSSLPPAATCSCSLDQVDAGGQLGDRVLDLEPGVDLQEGEPLLARVVQELDGAPRPGSRRPAPAARPTPSARRPAPAVSTGDADSSMTFWLRRCTEQSRTPSAQAVPWPSAITWTSTCRAPVTRRSRNTTPLPNARCASSAGALVGLGELARGGDHADAAPAAARGGLEHQRVADLVRRRAARRPGRRPRRGSTARPGRRPPRRSAWRRSCRRACASPPASGPDERDAEPLAQLGERRVLGDESPADPGGVRAASRQRPLQHGQVQVGPGRGGAEVVGQVGLPDERGRAVGVGVERDGLDPASRSPRTRSRTAWISRIAASPRLTMATRLNTDRASWRQTHVMSRY